MMRTSQDSDYLEGIKLTGQQLVFLNALTDGKWAQEEIDGWAPRADKWYERSEIKKKIGLKHSSILSERIITPLESAEIVEQMELPIKEGWKKMKKVVRIRKDFGERRLHGLVIWSALPLIRGQTGEKSAIKICEGMYKKSWKVLSILDEIEKERAEKEEAKYWEQRFQEFDNVPELITIEKRIYKILKQTGQRCCESSMCSMCPISKRPVMARECPMLKRPGMAFMIACEVSDWRELSRRMDSPSEEPASPFKNRDAILQILYNQKRS